MNSAPESQRGLALGAWGAVQASAAGVAVALGGVIHDLVSHTLVAGHGPAAAHARALGYTSVYVIELVLLAATILAMAPLIRRPPLPAAAASGYAT